jgi:hypothetical protein
MSCRQGPFARTILPVTYICSGGCHDTLTSTHVRGYATAAVLPTNSTGLSLGRHALCPTFSALTRSAGACPGPPVSTVSALPSCRSVCARHLPGGATLSLHRYLRTTVEPRAVAVSPYAAHPSRRAQPGRSRPLSGGHSWPQTARVADHNLCGGAAGVGSGRPQSQ